MNPDILTPAESVNENKFMARYLSYILVFILGLWIGNALACVEIQTDITIDQIRSPAI